MQRTSQRLHLVGCSFCRHQDVRPKCATLGTGRNRLGAFFIFSRNLQQEHLRSRDMAGSISALSLLLLFSACSWTSAFQPATSLCAQRAYSSSSSRGSSSFCPTSYKPQQHCLTSRLTETGRQHAKARCRSRSRPALHMAADYYQTLGLSKGASAADIKASFRKVGALFSLDERPNG